MLVDVHAMNSKAKGIADEHFTKTHTVIGLIDEKHGDVGFLHPQKTEGSASSFVVILLPVTRREVRLYDETMGAFVA